ncbi:hypothetical protein F1640_10635 [Novosphingobium sp. NBM11]|uniref:hypothetical protein n=1 Tax=Novosphingobium sp. NBM11 TaxID=2596914 RepID=UPI0018921C3C|nr:hypothetical protein [Novosphingobium sp. NBM11]MBF5090461.1 hypothetical protein [Novosphingobium sp. NBM11]
MSDGDRNGNSKALNWVPPVVGVFLAVSLSWGIGWLQAREEYKRENTPTAYAEAAKKDAERACVGVEPRAVFECVNEKTEAAYQTAHDEQDLSAQQRAASSALASSVLSFFSLLLSGIGVWYVKRTLDATLQAVKDTGDATDEMRKANAISNRIAEAELRPYLFVDHLKLIDIKRFTDEIEEDGESKTIPNGFSARVSIHLRNYGKVPARNIHVTKRLCMARFYRGELSHFRRGYVDTPVCAPGHERRVFDGFYIGKDDLEEFNEGRLEYVIRLKFTYEDDKGGKFSEIAGYRLSGDDLETFYLLLGPHNIYANRKRWAEMEPDLYDNADDGVEEIEDQSATPS